MGLIIKAVHTDLQEGSAKDFSWVGRVMSSNKFTDNMKDGLRDVCLHLDITSASRYNPAVEEQNVPKKESWERAEGDDDDTPVVVEEEEEEGEMLIKKRNGMKRRGREVMSKKKKKKKKHNKGEELQLLREEKQRRRLLILPLIEDCQERLVSSSPYLVHEKRLLSMLANSCIRSEYEFFKLGLG